ncbi:MAG: iron complex outermembrane receptor protein [Cyclobacteriaceae bacterium]|jgi:iron complex outermembrane receptor protein
MMMTVWGWAQSDQSCDFKLGGKVIDVDTNEPLPYVTIKIDKSDQGTITNDGGEFLILGICDEEFDFTVTHVGYKSTHHHHDAYHDFPTILLAPDNQILESVVIEGTYNPTVFNTLKLDRISSFQFENQQSGTLADIASHISGVSMLSTGQNVVKPIIHGLHSNRILIINNGVRHESQNWGAAHAPEVDPSLANSLEVVKGAATVRYGPEALGGVLLISPDMPELSSGFALSGKAFGTTNGGTGSGEVTIQQGWEHFIVDVRANILRQGDMSAPDYVLTNTGKNERSFSAALKYHTKTFDIEGYYSRFVQNLGILRGSVNGSLTDLEQAILSDIPNGTMPFAYAINNPRQQVYHDLVKIKGSWVRAKDDLQLQYSYQNNQRQEYDVRRGTNNELPSIDLQLRSHILDLDWNHPAFGEVTGVAGAQLSYQDNDNIPGTNTAPFIPNFQSSRVGFFIIENLNRDRNNYEAGLRYDFQHTSVIGRKQDNLLFNDQLNFAQLTGSIGASHAFVNAIKISSNLGLGWRPPNVSELYSFGKHGPSIDFGLWRYTFDENKDINATVVLTENDKPVRPEVGWKWINSLTGQNQTMSWEATAYANWIQHYIYTRPAGITNTVRGAFPYFVFDQTDAVFLGVDLAFKKDFSKYLSSSWQTSYVYAKDISNNSFFVEMPPARIQSSWQYDRSFLGLSSSMLSVDLSYSFKYWNAPRVISISEIIAAESREEDLFANEQSMFDFIPAPDGYFLMDFSWNVTKGKMAYGLQIKNALNQSYRSNTDRLRYFADNTGRNIYFSIGYKL